MALLAFIAFSAAQSSTQTRIHRAILVIDTSNNASYNQVHWLVRTPYMSIKASNDLIYFNTLIFFVNVLSLVVIFTAEASFHCWISLKSPLKHFHSIFWWVKTVDCRKVDDHTTEFFTLAEGWQCWSISQYWHQKFFGNTKKITSSGAQPDDNWLNSLILNLSELT